MKRFIKKISIFIFILTAYFLVNTVLNYAIFNKIKPPIKNSDIFIMGDSHPFKAIDPSMFRSATNLAMLMEPYILTFWKLEYLVNNAKPDTILLGFGHQNISAFNDKKFIEEKWVGEMFKRSYLIGKVINIGLDVDFKVYLKVFYKKMLIYPHSDHFNFIDTYSNTDSNQIDDIIPAIKRHFYNEDNQPIGISPVQIQYLDSILNLCRRKNIKIFLISSPVHHEYFSLIPESMKQIFNKKKSEIMSNGFDVIDMSESVFDDDCFQNADHLNSKGAKKFTNDIKSIIF